MLAPTVVLITDSFEVKLGRVAKQQTKRGSFFDEFFLFFYVDFRLLSKQMLKNNKIMGIFSKNLKNSPKKHKQNCGKILKKNE